MKLVKNKNMLLLFVLFAMIILMSIGYASINSVTGDIEGEAISDAQEGVFITNIEYVSDVNASASNSRVNKFFGTVMDSTMQLSDTDVNSNITYKVTVYNKGTDLNFVIKAPNRMMANSAYKYNGYNYLNGDIANTKIETITFKQGKKSDITADIKSEFDASEKQNKSIIGYYTDENEDGMYDLIFMSEEPIYANKDSSYLFYNLTNLTSIDLSNFKTDGVKEMSYMFGYCIGLTSLYVSEYNSATQKGWTTENVTSSSSMFDLCTKLVGGNGTKYNSNYKDATYARIDTAENLGYLTKKE